MPFLVVRRGRELRHADVARVEWRDETFDATTLAGGIPSLEDDAQRRPEGAAVAEQPAADQSELEQAVLRYRKAIGFLVRGQSQRQVDVKGSHETSP